MCSNQIPAGLVEGCGALTRGLRIKLQDYMGVSGCLENYINEPRSKGTRTLVVMHPHGIFTFGTFLCLINPVNDGMTLAGSDVFDWFFLHKIYCMMFGKILRGCSKAVVTDLMKRKVCTIGLIPGGFIEASLTKASANRMYIPKGFIKLCMTHGYTPEAVLVLGENLTYSNIPVLFGLRRWLAQNTVCPGVLPVGWCWCPLLPDRIDFKVCSKRVEIKSKDLDECYDGYILDLVSLYKDKMRRDDGDLVLVDRDMAETVA